MTEEQKDRLIYLLTRRRKELLNDEEQTELDKWASENPEIFAKLTDDQQILLDLKEGHLAEKRVLKLIKVKTLDFSEVSMTPVRPMSAFRKLNWYYCAAAIVGILIGVALLGKRIHFRKSTDKLEGQVIVDLAPGGNRAVLALGNGSVLDLDSIKNGSVLSLGHTGFKKVDSGLISFADESRFSSVIENNTVITPRAAQYALTLPDGTKVWLNAASSLTFPSAFTGNTREVKLTGEGYFEVAHNSSKPFVIQVNQTSIRVLGTDFDVMAYSDERVMKTSLLSGAISVRSPTGITKALSPGSRAESLSDGSIDVKEDPGVANAIGWVKGRFIFRHDSITTVMNQLARWYDVQIIYDAVPIKTFSGFLNRNNNASAVLSVLEATGGVHFKIDGKTIRVMK